MSDLNKMFVKVAAGKIGDGEGQVLIGTIDTESSSNSKKVYFVEDTHEIVVNGVHYGINNSSDVDALKAVIGESTDSTTGDNAKSTLWAKVNAAVTSAGVTSFAGKSGDITVAAASEAVGAINLSVSDDGELSASMVSLGLGDAAKKAVATSVSTDSASDDNLPTEKAVRDAIDAAKKDILTGGADETINASYDTLKEVADWIAANDGDASNAGALISKVNANTSAIGTANTAAEGETSTATGLYKYVDDAIADIDVPDFGELDSSVEVSDSNSLATVKVAQIDGKLDSATSSLTLKVKALADAVGMTYDSANKTWSASDGSVTEDGLVTASDVAAEIVADELVIASALNDHETRVAALEAWDMWEEYTVSTVRDE